MSHRATYEDANLILRLYELRREPRLREARRWFGAHFRAATMQELNVLCPPGSEENASYRMVTSYWEMAASFVTNGVIDRELFFQNCQELLFVWVRLRELLPAARQAMRSPLMWKNLESVAAEFEAWWDERSPGYMQAFAERVLGLVAPPKPAST
jgi:hypothetical protein